ncbi:MFS transporter [Megamonas hypermegale]|uniref:MFS transporter n=1 Tax=Megamonas hypermegale TaxID=158847 RepID=UPI00255C9046|nr:MFS transporter [Megamonas hypermegale]
MLKTNCKQKANLFLISQSITLLGSTLVQMVIIWYITVKTLSGCWVALFSICAYLPQFLISFWGGVWADRFNCKKIIMVVDIFIAVVTLFMILVIPYIDNEFIFYSLLLITLILRSLGAGIQTPTVNVVISKIVSKRYLMQYNSLNTMIQSIMQCVVPLVAGIILSFTSLEVALWIDVLTAIVGNVILYQISMGKSSSKININSTWQDIKCIINYVLRNEFIINLLFVYGIYVLGCVPAGFLAGLFVSRFYDSSYEFLVFVECIGFGGMIIGGFLVNIWGKLIKKEKILYISLIIILYISLIIFGLMAILMGIIKNFLLYLVFMCIYGMALTIIQIIITTLLQEKTDINVQGKIFGIMSTIYSGFIPFGLFIFGILADIISLSIIMVISGIVLMVLSIWNIFKDIINI